MALVPKTIVPSLGTGLPCNGHRVPNQSLYAGAALAAGDACYINADGTVYPATGAAANAAANVDGFVSVDVAIGVTVTLFTGVEFSYGPATLVPGTRLYLSGVTAGGLDATPSTGGTRAIAKVVYVNNNASTPHAVIRVEANL
jgi:hypothetical protein